MNIDDLLADARQIWGNDTVTLEMLLVCLGVVVGDMHRLARDSSESGELDRLALKKEMGNVIFSMIRWCDDLGLDPKECIALAKQAQIRYKKQTERPSN